MLLRLILILSIVLGQLAAPGFGVGINPASPIGSDDCCAGACRCDPDACPCVDRAPDRGENPLPLPIPNEQTTSRAPLLAMAWGEPAIVAIHDECNPQGGLIHLTEVTRRTAHERCAWLCVWLT